LDRQFDEELSTHLELLVDEYRRGGMAPDEARREAIRKLGRPETLRQSHRDQRGIPVLEMLAQDLYYAFRILRKSPGFTCIATLSLALGIGANTALFSLVDTLLIRSLPVRDPERLVQVQQINPTGYFKKGRMLFPKTVFDSVRAYGPIVSEVVGFARMDRPSITIDGAPDPPREVERVSENFFRDLGVKPILGRSPEPSDGAVAMVSYRMWRDRFGSTAGVLGRALIINGGIFTIVGVAPRQFLGLSIENSLDLWISSGPAADQMMIVRLQAGVTPAQAEAALDARVPQLEEQAQGLAPRLKVELLPAGKGVSLSRLREQYQRPLLALMGLVILVLLITCINVGNLLTVRNSARRRELTVRVALGAGRSRLAMQCLVESALLAAFGAILGLVFARWGASMILSMLPLPAIPQALVFQADARVLGFAAAASLASAVMFGLAPSWRATRVDLTANLKSGHGSTQAKGTRLFARALVACQVALSVLLLVAAGLFVQTIRNLTRLDLGFNTKKLLQVSIDTSGAGYAEGQVAAVYRLLLERVSAIPGVRGVTVVRNPLFHGLSRCASDIRGLRRAGDETWDCVDVGPAFFETLNIPLLRGRLFTESDFARGQALFIVNEPFLKHFFPDSDPVGKTRIVGVVGNTKLSSLRRENGPLMYYMVRKEPDRINALEVRAAEIQTRWCAPLERKSAASIRGCWSALRLWARRSIRISRKSEWWPRPAPSLASSDWCWQRLESSASHRTPSRRGPTSWASAWRWAPGGGR
jgi:predicted permease